MNSNKTCKVCGHWIEIPKQGRSGAERIGICMQEKTLVHAYRFQNEDCFSWDANACAVRPVTKKRRKIYTRTHAVGIRG